MNLRTSTFLLFATLLVSFASAAPVRPTETSAPALPAYWSNVSVTDRLSAMRAAQVDAMRLLTETVYGTLIVEGTSVEDFVGTDSEVRAATAAVLRGAMLGDPEYLDDGRVMVAGSIKLRDIVTTLKITLKKSRWASLFGKTRYKALTSIDVTHLDRVVEVYGSGAIAGSIGQKKLLAKRAAEVDAYRRLAERIMGTVITSDTTVRNYAVQYDRIRTRLARIIRGAEYMGIELRSDGEAVVTLKIALADVDRMLRDEIEFGTPVRALSAGQAKQFLTEAGHGAWQDEAATMPSKTSAEEPFADVVSIVASSTRQGVVISD